MNRIVLFEDGGYVNLLPCTFWLTVFELRVGRKIILDRAAQRLNMPIAGIWTRDWISKVAEQRCGAPVNRAVEAGTILINGRWLFDEPVEFPDPPCVGVVGEEFAFVVCDDALASRLTFEVLLDDSRTREVLGDAPRVVAPGRLVHYLWDIIGDLPELLRREWSEADRAIDSDLPAGLSITNGDWLHVGERTQIHPTAILNASQGPLYISHDVRIGPYCVLEGPLYVGPGSVVHPHSWLHKGNAIGPVCRVAGELACCVIQGYTNKQHEGYLGHAYVGSWVNFGAGSVNSDLKNTYGSVRVPLNGIEVDTGRTFFGAIIADHAKIGINCAVPTGAVIGFAASASSSGLIPKYVPSFGWVTEQGLSAGKPPQLLDVAVNMMVRRNIDMTDQEIELFLDLGTRVRSYESRPRTLGR